MKVLILHAHWNNRGDEAALRAMIDSLRSQLSVEKTWIMMVSFAAQEFPYRDIEILRLYPTMWYWLDWLDAAVNILTFGTFSITTRGKKFLRALKEADVVIHAPGGPTIGDLNPLGDYQYLHRLLMAKIFLRKPLFFYAPSMGPFSGRLRNVLRRFILGRADAIVLREEISQTYLREQLGLEARVTVDSALQNDIPEDYLSKYGNVSEILAILGGNKTVGMVAADLKWHPSYRDHQDLAQYTVSCFQEVAAYLIQRGYSILLIPQLFGEVEDVGILERIREVDTEHMWLCPPNVDSFGQQVIIGKLFGLVSMRYHPVIFAAKAGVPFVSVYYEHKAEGFVRKTGLGELAVPVDRMSPSEIIDRFRLLERDYDRIREQLAASAVRLKEDSRQTTRIIVDKLGEYGWNIDGDRRSP